ncbi:hypothetical protein [Yimella sp. cx-51]|uniref:hypothetical protein n=1 Tax=Yimella sp. cx-51 TaxID=2770551 RepID=UPI00165D8C35|nr:hypothetical protein [Yimella sp. cx-51]MBC9958360.1 hypothetical protein [Yimella sp. cx-51]QTH39743.1 hypothetical protein J5M86_15310 [Yimella sp. cx-51]
MRCTTIDALGQRTTTEQWVPRKGHRTVAPDGAYSAIPAWKSREHWLAVVVPVALHVHAAKLHRRVSAALMRRYLDVKSGYANPSSGRRCIVRPDTVASVLGVLPRTVKLLAKIAREIGLEVVIETGRMLTMEERWPLIRAGSKQRGLSTEVAFTVPRALGRSVWINTPPRGPSVRGKLTLKTGHLTHKTTTARGRKTDAASPRLTKRDPRRTAAARTLAADVARKLTWCQSEPLSRLTPALTRFATATTPWTADDVITALQDQALRRGQNLDELRVEQIRTRPAAVLAGLLRDLDVDGDHPGLVDQAPEPEPIPDHSCDHGWVDVLDETGQRLGVARCIGGWRCAQLHAYEPDLHGHDDEPAF